MFAKQQPWTNFEIWVPCGKPLKNKTFFFWGDIWEQQGFMMVSKLFWQIRSLGDVFKLKCDTSALIWRVAHVFGITKQKSFRKTKGRQIKSQGCNMHSKMRILCQCFHELYFLQNEKTNYLGEQNEKKYSWEQKIVFSHDRFFAKNSQKRDKIWRTTFIMGQLAK